MRHILAYVKPLEINKLSNTTTAEPSLKDFPTIPLTTFIGVSVGVFACVGILANILVLIVLSISQRNKRFSPYRYLITHLALSDCLCSIFLVVYVPVEIKNHDWLYNEHACKIVYPCITILTNLSVGTIMIITVERYRGVIFPYKSPWKPKNLQIAIATVWIVGILIVVPSIATIRVTPYKNLLYCNENWEIYSFLKERKYLRKVYGISFFFLAFALPALSMMFMHASIIYRLKKPELEPDNMSNYQLRTNARIMKVLTSVIVAFIVCVSPNKLLYFVWDMRPDLEKSFSSNARFYMRTFQILFYSRTAINPLLYCFFDTRFRKDLQNTSKAIRGASFVDSDLTKSRARTLSQRNGSSQVLRSRAASALSGLGQPVDLSPHFLTSDLITKLSTVQEPEVIIKNSYINNVIQCERMRSGSTETIVHTECGSSSPLVKGGYMRDASKEMKL